MAMPDLLGNLIAPRIEKSLGRHSRAHPLTAYLPQHPGSPVYIKREDELGSGVIGSKLRKYLSLLPAIEQAGIDEVILIGSAHSNHVISLAQLLIQRSVRVKAFVKRPGSSQPMGNLLFLRMLLDAADIRYVAPADWPDVEHMAQEYAEAREPGGRVLVVPEGGACRQVIPGIFTLALDILRNERDLGIRFDDIWTDSGTGVSAIGLLIGLALAGETERNVHITLIAGSEAEFLARLDRFKSWTEQTPGFNLPQVLPSIRFHRPATAPSFGSVNSTLLEETRRIASLCGILMDPVYSAKHFLTVRERMVHERPAGSQLVLYNGGSLGLCGFQLPLAGSLQETVD